jgi:hydroxymethylglutaryl-CoA lyase
MADSETVLASLQLSEDIEIIGIVVNQKGAGRAISTGRVHTLGFPYSTSPQFLERNQHQTQRQALDALAAINLLSQQANLKVIAYLSMAFGNPYGEDWNIGLVLAACRELIDSGVRQISLADTVGLATPSQIAEIVTNVLAAHASIELGIHLHARAADAHPKILAAYQAGCRRFDSAVGGLGGCPFAQDALVGNIATETLLPELHELGADLPDLGPLSELVSQNAEFAKKCTA